MTIKRSFVHSEREDDEMKKEVVNRFTQRCSFACSSSCSEEESDEETKKTTQRSLLWKELGDVVAEMVKESDIGVGLESDEKETKKTTQPSLLWKEIGDVVAEMVKESDVDVGLESDKETKTNLSLLLNEDPCRFGLKKAVEYCAFAAMNRGNIYTAREISVHLLLEKLPYTSSRNLLGDVVEESDVDDVGLESETKRSLLWKELGDVVVKESDVDDVGLESDNETLLLKEDPCRFGLRKRSDEDRTLLSWKEIGDVVAVMVKESDVDDVGLESDDKETTKRESNLLWKEYPYTVRDEDEDCTFAAVNVITMNRGNIYTAKNISVHLLQKLLLVRCKELGDVVAVTVKESDLDVNNDAPGTVEVLSETLGNVLAVTSDRTAPQGKEADTPLAPSSVTQRPRRPVSGSIGKRIMIRSNHFQVIITSQTPDLKEFHVPDREEKQMLALDELHKLLKKCACQRYSIHGRYYFGLNSERTDNIEGDLGMGLQYIRGLFRVLRFTQNGLFLNADVLTKCFYQPMDLTEFIKKYFNIRELNRNELTNDKLAMLEKALTGLKVELTHSPYQRKAKIKGFSLRPIGQLRFNSNKSGTEVKVTDYFRDRYGHTVKYPYLPAIGIGNGEYVPMELCRIITGQQYTRRGLTDQQTKTFRTVSIQKPAAREDTIKSMVRIDKQDALALVNNELDGVMSVSSELVLFEARVLPPPMLRFRDFHNREVIKPVTPELGKWSMFGQKMINGASVNRWACVNFSTLGQGEVRSFCGALTRMCSNLGMVCANQPVIPHISYQPEQIEYALREIHNRAAKIQILIVILPNTTGSYGKIKKICETELGIVSQCIQPEKARRNSKPCLQSLALKINMKAGGQNYVLEKNIPLITNKPTIIFGADVTHPSETGQLSLAAVVASMGWPAIGKYRALVSAQTEGQEIIQDLYKPGTGMIRDQLLAFFRNTNRQKPESIIFFRDGVGETQFEEVLRSELNAIRQACFSIEESYSPAVTFVVVQKRHHTRFFPAQDDMADTTGNVLPGTVVDTTICHPYEFDFYLSSHAAEKGTSRPAHYHVLFDENRFSSDDLQELTHSLCYTFGKTTTSVSLVTPVYYAHLAAFRARYYMEGEMPPLHLPAVKDNVKDTMFFF